MSVIITKDDLRAYAEVDYIIKHMNEKYRLKVPQNLLYFFETIKDPNYEVHIEAYQPLQNQGLTKYALEVIALLHIKYWCENQERKTELIEKMRKNQAQIEAKLREQFSSEAIFNASSCKTETKITNQDAIMTAYSKYMKTNPDIQDFTDLREYLEEEIVIRTPKMRINVLEKIKAFFSKIAGKKKN